MNDFSYLLESPGFPTGKYNIIYADPPWSPANKGIGTNGRGAACKQYNVMSIEDIAALPVTSIAADDSLLFMWWLASMPAEALALVKAWGFTVKNMTCFSWLKQTTTGRDFFGMGYYSRANQEQCLVARRGKSIVKKHNVEQNIRAVNVRHSQKPQEARDRIIEMCGDVPRIELFAREKADGWDAWGDQL